MIFANFLQAFFDCSSFLALRQTIFPFGKIRAVAFSSFIFIINPENFFGSYLTLLAFKAISFKCNLQFNSAVLTIFCISGTFSIPLELISFEVFFVSTLFPGISFSLPSSLFSTPVSFLLGLIIN